MIIIFLMFVYMITNLIYPENFTFIIINNTDSTVDSISFKTSESEIDDIIISSITPNSTVKINKEFFVSGETLLATVKNNRNEDFTFPLSHIYTPKDTIVIKLYINYVEDGKVQKLTRKTFSPFNANNLLEQLLPWWVRVHYDYSSKIVNIT